MVPLGYDSEKKVGLIVISFRIIYIDILYISLSDHQKVKKGNCSFTTSWLKSSRRTRRRRLARRSKISNWGKNGEQRRK